MIGALIKRFEQSYMREAHQAWWCRNESAILQVIQGLLAANGDTPIDPAKLLDVAEAIVWELRRRQKKG